MTTFIDLSRRFRDLTPAELEEPELLAALSERELHPLDGWPELLKHARVLILAEAGSGKTIEMNEQAKKLVRDGKIAFFIALESLDREPLFDILSTDDELLLKTWLEDGKSPAWFFLDAVDELKLTNGKFDRAIRRFAKSINGHLDRARILISCRPYDWRPEVDMATVRQLLPISQQTQPSRPEPDQIFLAALRQEGSERRSDDEGLALTDTVRTVVLVPLGRGQVERLARSLDVIDTEAFLAEIDKQNAWTFARRPLDLSELVATWAKSKRLGTRVEQHEANIAAKLWDDTDRPDHNVLPDTRARIGAERLALALALTRTRTIRSPDQALALERAEGVLDPTQVLNDWSEHERRTLLRRALFDPATYGRVRFHHRSVQEYLAACHFQGLRDSGMSTNAMLRLLFANRYGVDVVIPSMRAIAAWLALWDEAVRRELMAREPEALLSLGDPETLPLEARAKLVRAFAAAYGKGGWRGLGAPIDEVRRLAHPELAEVVQELWGSGPTNTDVRELLLELIWQGRMESCADIANSAALDTNLPYHHRVVAIRSLLAIGRNVEVRDIAEKVLGEPGAWPDRYISALLEDLFPRVLSVAELMTLIEHFDGYTRGVESFVWSIEQIVESLDPTSHLAIEFRDALADLLWRGRDGEQSSYQIRSRFSDLAPALALLCGRQLAQRTGHPEAALVRASVLAARFGEGLTDAHNRIRQVRGLCNDDMHLREAIFWTELTVMDKLTPAGDDWNRLFNVEEHSLIKSLQQSDQPWLEAALIKSPTQYPIS